MKYKTKNEGISLLIAMGGSFLVLIMAFATLLSIQKTLAQVESLERSTRLFFATESGIEAAFYHHNSRGAGVEFTDISSASNSQKIEHLNGSIISSWTIKGRSKPVVGLLREDETVQIPLHWDNSVDPTQNPNTHKDKIGGTPNEEFYLTFYNDSADMSAADKAVLEAMTNGSVTIPNNFNFGDDGDNDDTDGDRGADGNEILIDWSVSRTVSGVGIQTFNPKGNKCKIGDPASDFICEQTLLVGKQTISPNPSNDTKATGTREGRVLPGYADQTVSLHDFMECSDSAAAGNCSDYTLTFRALLNFKDTNSNKKIPGIPYTVSGSTNSGSTKKSIPKQNYTVTSVVEENNFSQTITLEVPEKTSIGAFDYVIFD